MPSTKSEAALTGRPGRLRLAAATVVGGIAAASPGYLHALPRAAPAPRRSAQPSTARSRISAAKPRRDAPIGPTPERLLKDDIAFVAGAHRSMPPVERLYRDGRLDDNAARNDAMHQAAEKLYRHYVGAGLVGVQAQDLNRIVARGSSDELVGEENWVAHYQAFQFACRLMGWSEANPRRGAGRLVVAVVCHEQTVTDAAIAHVGPGKLHPLKAVGMDRLREGLHELAVAWGFLPAR